MQDEFKKIALLKDDDDDSYIILILLNNKLSYIRSKENLDRDVLYLKYNFVVKTYGTDPNSILNVVYKSDTVRGTTNVVSSNGIVADEIGSDVYVVYTNKIVNVMLKEGRVVVNVNAGCHRVPDHIDIDITPKLYNCITYNNKDKYVILNNIPLKIIKTY